MMITMADASFAQTFGVKAGLNLSNILIKDDNETYSDDLKIKPGFHVGTTTEFNLTEMFSLETGFLFSTKGYKINNNGMKGKMNLLYIDIPLTARGSFDVRGTKMYGLLGPYIGFGLIGTTKSEYDGETEENDIEWGPDEENDILKRLDYGLTVGAGVEINSIQLGLSYSLGMANISPNTEDGFRIKNRVLGISLGYKLSRSK
jgi:hypothetical protein